MTDLPRRVGKLEDGFEKFAVMQSEMNLTLARMDLKLDAMASTEFVRQEISTAVNKFSEKLKEVTDPIKQTGEDNKKTLTEARIEIARLDERSKKVPTTTTVAGFLALATLVISLVGQWQNIGSYFGFTKSPESISASRVKAVPPPPAGPSKSSGSAPENPTN